MNNKSGRSQRGDQGIFEQAGDGHGADAAGNGGDEARNLAAGFEGDIANQAAVCHDL